MRLIAFTGLKGSGKDTAASVLVAQGYEPQKMAGGLKAMLRAFLAYQGVDDETIERMLEGDLKEVPSEHLGGRTPRYAMQTLGTEWGRNLMAEDLWVAALGRRLPLFPRNVISDVRFPNEVAFVWQHGGNVVRVVRWDATADQHESERLVAGLSVDAEIYNDYATADDFRGAVQAHFAA